jgi:hypothetical protein
MASKYFTLLILSFALLPFAQAQRKADSAQAVKTFQLLLAVCKKAGITNPDKKVTGDFSRAAPYIIYRGEDKTRAWKTFADYSKAEDKKRVDELCNRINGTINRYSIFRIVKYHSEKESEGTWHVLTLRWQKNGEEKETAFAFLKIGKRFGLGDID